MIEKVPEIHIRFMRHLALRQARNRHFNVSYCGIFDLTPGWVSSFKGMYCLPILHWDLR